MQETTSYSDLQNQLKDNDWVLLYYSAGWCGPCISYSPIIEKVGEAYQQVLTTLKVDVEQVPESAGEQRIQAVPTLVLLNKGKPVDSTVGAQTQSQVMQWLNGHMLIH